MPTTNANLPSIASAPPGPDWAQLVLGQNGASLRRVVTGSKRHVTGSYCSTKTRQVQQWEGLPELHRIYESEIDAEVSDYLAQPFRLDFITGGQKQSYIADHVLERRDGTVEVIEVKRNNRDLRCADYRRRLSLARSVFTQLGWDFQVQYLHERELSPVRLANLEYIQSKRTVAVAEAYLTLLRDVHRHGAKVLEFGEVELMIANEAGLNPSRPDMIVYALIAKGYLKVDLDHRITRRSVLRLYPPFGERLSSFRSLAR